MTTHRHHLWRERAVRARPILADPEPDGTGLWQQRVPGPQLPGLISGVTLLAGIWLVLAPYVWSYGDTGGGFDARWNDVLTGVAVAAAGYARLARPVRLITVTVVSVVFGVWLAIAPFALEYNLGADPTRATVNDVLVGTLVTGLALVGYFHARDAADEHP
jgi:hypothetical protein